MRGETRKGEIAAMKMEDEGNLCYSEVLSNEDIVSNLSHMTTMIEASKHRSKRRNHTTSLEGQELL